MIEMRSVGFRYETGFELSVEDLIIGQGSQVCWVGPSGCGKTTLLHLVAGIYPVSEGNLKVCDADLSTRGDSWRREFRIANVGLVFQDFALLNYLSVLENILLPYRLSSRLKLDASVRDRARQLAERVGLGDKLGQIPTELSQGECQRIAVCRAVVAKPKLILADEPTANLDAENSKVVLDLLTVHAAEHDATLVVVSHDRDVITTMQETIDVSRYCQQRLAGTVGGGIDGR